MTTVPGKPNKFIKMPTNNIIIKIANPAAAKVDKLFLPLHFRKSRIFKKQHDGASDIDRGIGANDDADQHGKSKIVNNRSAETIQGENREKNGQRSQDGSAQRLINAQVDDIAQLPFGIQFYIFPNSVKDHYRIVNGKTDNENE